MFRSKIAAAKNIAGNSVSSTIDIDLAQSYKFTILVIPNAPHIFGVAVNWDTDLCSGSGKVQDVVLPVPVASHGNFLSQIIESKADIAAFEITNGDGAAHTYDIYIHRI